jgi:hypothetical protein
MDGAESRGQLLFLDGVFGIDRMVWNVGRDAKVFDFGGWDFWRVVG